MTTPPEAEVLWTTSEWARAIVCLPAAGPLATRTVLVPGEPVAHALRRELVRIGHAAALAGTRFVPTAAAAVELLHAAETEFESGEEALRAPRLLALFRRGLPLQHFSLELLRDKPGWDEAFARTIGDFEGAGLRPDDVERLSADVREREGSAIHTSGTRLRDVGAIWRSVDGDAARSWTVQRIYLEAARLLERRPDLWRFSGPVLAATSGHASAAQARFLRAIPGVRLALLGARPLRDDYVTRVQALFGPAAARAVARASAPRVAIAAGAAPTERAILASYLFEPPAVLADRSRPRSAGPDGTVDLDEHAGVEEELEATADWVARHVLAGTPLEEIAVLVPALDPLAGLVAERLARLPWPAPAAGDPGERDPGRQHGTPVYVARGLPLTSVAAGARALAVIRALRAHLAGEALAQVLPALRIVPRERSDTDARRGAEPRSGPRHLTHGAAMELVWSLGTAGGNAAEPRRALEWAERAAARERDLARLLAATTSDPERAGTAAREARDVERLLANLGAVRPALDALVAVARLVVDDRPLAELWPALRAFLATHVLQPGGGPPAHALLDDRLGAVAAQPATGQLTGDDALRVIEEMIDATRLAIGRFGEPAIYVGTLHEAIGLPFRVVRVIGLAEGHLPPPAHEDPVVPDRLRRQLEAPGADGRTVTPRTAADLALAALHALDAAVRDAGQSVALSAPRLDIERSQREPASILLEAAAALGRPNAVTGEPAGTIPDVTALRRDAFAPARRAALDFRCVRPIATTAWLDAVARGAVGIPGPWRGIAALDLQRIAALRDAPTLDGLLDDVALAVPGLTRQWPVSPSALGTLLQCPHQFFLEHVLGLDGPPAAPPPSEIGQPYYGSLVHRVAEAFLRAHGAAFCAHEGTLEAWQAAAETIVEREFAAFLEQYPLVGEAVRGVQRNRLLADVRELLEFDWAAPPRRFVAAERIFGHEAPVDLVAGGHSLFVRGRIDRVDVAGDVTLVRDLKTGRAHPRAGKDAEADPSLDVQIAIYALVVQRLAEAWGVPKTIAASYVYVGRSVEQREWPEFHGSLEPAARAWLSVAADLLAARAFPRTPESEDCRYCCFRPVCGEDVYERARTLLAGGDHRLGGFRALKGVEASLEGVEASPEGVEAPVERKRRR